MNLYKVKYIELYLSEVGDGDPELQYTQQEEYVDCDFKKSRIKDRY